MLILIKPFFPKGVNVNFFTINNDKTINILTYEKGVENVMRSCASGSTAVVFHLSQINAISSPIITKSIGGNLTITFDKKWQEAWVEGPAEFLFDGEFNARLLT